MPTCAALFEQLLQISGSFGAFGAMSVLSGEGGESEQVGILGLGCGVLGCGKLGG